MAYVEKLFKAAIVAAIAMAGAQAQATSMSGTIAVELNITAACVINGATAASATFGSGGTILFANQPGIFSDTSAQLVGSLGNLNVKCSPGTSPTMTIGSGANDNSGTRRLNYSGNNVPYHLYTDSSHTDEIAIGRQISLGSMTTSAVDVPIYASVNSGGAILPAGKYIDTVQVTLSW